MTGYDCLAGFKAGETQNPNGEQLFWNKLHHRQEEQKRLGGAHGVHLRLHLYDDYSPDPISTV